MLLHDVGIVEQPVTSRAYIDFPLGSGSQSIMNSAQDLASVIQSLEKRSVTSLLLRRQQSVFTRDVARMLRKPVGSENLPANRTYELPVSVVIRQTE